jgi:hypothetical protein
LDLGVDMKINFFRDWIRNIWYENREERLAFGENPITLEQYVRKNKWFLKRKFRKEGN